MRYIVPIIVLLLLAACGQETIKVPKAAKGTSVAIQQGKIIGSIAENGAYVWKGIPYAETTAGRNRWRAPQDPLKWADIRKMLTFGERCAQMTNAFDADEGLKAGLVVGSEDCLSLNIYTPPDAKERKLPVMVWIHGGGNVWGRASQYDGSRLSVQQNVIIVTVQYRLGPLGWFAHKSLRKSAADPKDRAASFAILDLVRSLEWVRDNIRVFGGDPSNVTIFGESSGGHNVAALLASPLSKGLFHRAIIQSGFFDSVSWNEAEGSTSGRKNPSNEISERLKVKTADELRALSVETLLRAYDATGTGFMDVPRMIQDGVAIPYTPLREAFASRETFQNVPIITGTTRDEMKLFYVGDNRLTKKRFWVFVTPRDQKFYDLVSNYVSRAWRIRAVDEPARLIAQSGHKELYSYRFDWDDGGKFLLIDFKTLFGAAHGFEIPFIFNHFNHLGDASAILFTEETAEHREYLSQAMGQYWASFARTGVPESAGNSEWPVYGENARFLRLDTRNDGGISVSKGADSFEKLISDLKGETNLDSKQRCFVVHEIGKWMWMYKMPVYASMKSEFGCGRP